MKPTTFRSGTNQTGRFKVPLQPDYISVEERSIFDLLRYTREYAKSVRFFDLNNQVSGFWSSFIDFTDDELRELAEYAENPKEFQDDPKKLERYGQPHLALLLAFLKLLNYPKAQFASLTRKHLEYFYREVLNLREKEEIPDQVHVIFKLAQDVNESLLKEGVLLSAGKDATGVDLQYKSKETVVLNRAEISDIKTIHFSKSTSDLKFLHLQYDRGDEGFEKILCKVLGRKRLPSYYNDFGIELDVDTVFLRTELYQRIQGKDRDDLAENDAEYIFESLSFPYLKDFRTCLDVFYREMNRGYVGVTIPEELEWEEVYTILEGVHRERISRTRRKELKEIHKTRGFEALLEYAFGEPHPGNMLFAMPGNITSLEELEVSETEAARKYIENHLCMTVDDFRVVMRKQSKSLGDSAGDEVYTILETAWTKKRDYQYPTIDSEFIEGYYADTVYNSAKDDSIERFTAFGKPSSAENSDNITMGFAVGSPLLMLNEGKREIELTVSAQEGSIDHDKISNLLLEEPDLFDIFLSTKNGWEKAKDTVVEAGKFVIKSPEKSYNEKYSYLVCDSLKYTFLNDSTIGWFVVFNNGKVYEIVGYNYADNKILLNSIYLSYASDTTRLISALVPKTFVDPINGELTIDKYAHRVVHFEESFADYHQGKYLVDIKGKIFFIKQFIAADTIDVRYCGSVSSEQKADLMVINRIWETIEPDYAVIGAFTDISELNISEIVSDDQEFRFHVTNRKLTIEYPFNQSATRNAHDMLTAWNAWIDDPANSSGRFTVSLEGNGSWPLLPFTKQIDLTGETIQRYESIEENGIRITYRGRPTDKVYLVINERSVENETCRFFIAGGVLTITPGQYSYTSNQVAADWYLWQLTNDTQGFQIESKDTHEWEVIPRMNVDLPLIDKRIKYSEIRNLYGNGIRVSYTGLESDHPILQLRENEIDMFDFEIVNEQQLIVKYPLFSMSSAHDLLEEWDHWQRSELNDPGSFKIQQLGDGLAEIEAKQTFAFQETDNQYIECALRDVSGATSPVIKNDTGMIALYRLEGTYRNALIEMIADPEPNARFRFKFEDSDWDTINGKTVPVEKKLTITFPKLNLYPEDHEVQINYQIRHVQECLSAWNRLVKKHNFVLVRREDDVTWMKAATATSNAVPLEQPFEKDFSKDLTYVCTVHPDGFKIKYDPSDVIYDPEDPNYDPDKVGTLPFTKTPKALLVLDENTPEDNVDKTETFKFIVRNDYPENLKILYIQYPTVKAKRTFKQLKADWIAAASTIGPEFLLEQAGTGKWPIEAVLDIPLTSEVTNDTPMSDEAFRRFFNLNTKDVNGFSVTYSGPVEIGPEVSFIETDDDTFTIEIESYDMPFYKESFERFLRIKYPKRKDKRRLVELFKAWNLWKTTNGNLAQGFEILDTTPAIMKRDKAPLLKTGDRIREYKVGGESGLCFTYMGHGETVDLEMAPIKDFSDQDIGKKVIWDNGEVFKITDRSHENTVSIEPVGSIELYDTIHQYTSDAVCLNALKFKTTVEPDFPAIAPFSQAPMSEHPMMQVLFNNEKEYVGKSSEAIYYEAFNSIQLEKVDLKVEVRDLSQISTRGHVAMINPLNAYQPFGTKPEKNSRFYFANREICEKKLDSLHINLHWKENTHVTKNGLPDMEAHYFAYSRCGLPGAPTISNDDFEVNLQFKDRRSWMSISNQPQRLFQQSLSYPEIEQQTYQGKLFKEDEELPKDPLDWKRHYKLELGDLGFFKEAEDEVRLAIADASNRLLIAKSDYDNIAQEIKARDASVHSAKVNEAKARAKGEDYIPPIIPKARPLPLIPENDKDLNQLTLNEAYSPFVEWISIDYSASATATFFDGGTPDTSLEMPIGFFRYHPFGYSEMSQLSHDDDDYLLPHYEKQGYLNIGVQNIKPTQSLSLLVQMVSGSGAAHLSIPQISWSYLAANKWIPFKESHILLDKTYGLQDTGIIRFSIPEDATMDNSVLPANRYWVRAEAPDNITAVPDIIDIQTQALLVEYVNNDNDPDHLGSPLTAETITALTERDPNIKEVKQPYSSFKGKKQEEPREFYTRTSERLKHKYRALSLNDYENLILAEFSEIYKVKCLPQNELKLLNADSEGEVVIVVILKNKNAKPFFPLKPKTPANILKDIEKHIKKFMPPLVSVKVVNPRFEEIQYRLAVKFMEGYDFGFYINQLNEDIKQFLSPWAYSKNADISFGSSVYSSSIINHIENIDYVDYVANFTLLKQIIIHEQYTETIPLFLTEDNAATAKYPDSILVSAENHIIDVIHTDLYDSGAFRGIGYMKIGTDFWVNRPGPVFSVGIGDMELEEKPVGRYAFQHIELEVTVTAQVGTDSYTEKFNSTFSQRDSETIWKRLIENDYIDDQGNVLAIESLYSDSFHLKFDKTFFIQFLYDNRSKFDFDLDLTANDFGVNPDEDVSFSYVIDDVSDRADIENKVVDILKEEIGNSGLSQYPFIVY